MSLLEARGRDPTIQAPPGLESPTDPACLPEFGIFDFLPPPGLPRSICEVWASNLDEEFGRLLSIAANAGPQVSISLSANFPMCSSLRVAEYKIIRGMIDLLSPVQFGLAVADSHGAIHGVWNFNMLFDRSTNPHAEACIKQLQMAGVNFCRHAREGIDPQSFGQYFACLVFQKAQIAPLWITHAGAYDLAYTLKMVSGLGLPKEGDAFHGALAALFPNRFELQDHLLNDSLQRLMEVYGLDHNSIESSAGNAALAMFDLYFHFSLAIDASTAAETIDDCTGAIEGWSDSASTVSLLRCEFLDDQICSRVDSSSIWCQKARRVSAQVSFSTDAPSSLWASCARSVASEARSCPPWVASVKKKFTSSNDSSLLAQVHRQKKQASWLDVVIRGRVS